MVGVLIALIVLLPETGAALRAARGNRMQSSLNLALGSGLASIGLTIPVVAAASPLFPFPLVLGLPPMQIVLLTLTLGCRHDHAGQRPRDGAARRRAPGAVRGVPVPGRGALTDCSVLSGALETGDGFHVFRVRHEVERGEAAEAQPPARRSGARHPTRDSRPQLT